MKKIFTRHWPFFPAGLALALLLILFWFFNQSYLAPDKSDVARLLENPLLTFGIVIAGAYLGASISGEFNFRLPVTFEPLVLAALGGVVVGIGASIARMSVHSTTLFNLAGIFTLPAFMITKGWVYAVFMILGGLAGSKLLPLIILKTATLKRDLHVPERLSSKNNQRLAFNILVSVFAVTLITVIVSLPEENVERTGLLLGVILLVTFGFITERSTICMSSMMKEWFISHSAYVWRSVAFTIMVLAFMYQTGLRFSLYEPIETDVYVASPWLLAAGSILMGFGFIFADGCFIGSLWKAGQGNLINIVALVGLLAGMGVSQIADKFIGELPNLAGTLIPNYLNSIISPEWFLILLWLAGGLLLLIFQPKRYRY